jgi:hypothetical protein
MTTDAQKTERSVEGQESARRRYRVMGSSVCSIGWSSERGREIEWSAFEGGRALEREWYSEGESETTII